MDKQPQGPSFDRFLMRVKDFIIIGAAVYSMTNWIMKRSESQESRFRVIEERLANIDRVLLNRK